jgi:uncharacterized membrane protein YkgB
VLGVIEIAIAVTIALRAVSPTVCAIGSALAIGMFFTALTFILSTPGWEASLGGFPALSVVPGQFILKDIVLLGAAVWSLNQATYDWYTQAAPLACSSAAIFSTAMVIAGS